MQRKQNALSRKSFVNGRTNKKCKKNHTADNLASVWLKHYGKWIILKDKGNAVFWRYIENRYFTQVPKERTSRHLKFGLSTIFRNNFSRTGHEVIYFS